MAALKRITCLLLLAAPLLANAAAPVDPTAELAQSYARQALAEARSPRGVAPLLHLQSLRDEVEELGLLANTFSQLAGQPAVDPFVRATAKAMLMDVEKARGHNKEAAELSRQLGYLHDFYVAGGFDNEGKAGCGTDFGPEAALDLKASYAAKGKEVSWRKVTLAPMEGYVDLSTMVRPNKEAVAYAVTFLDAPRDTEVNLAFGTSGGHRLWVNGQLASTSDRYNSPRPDQQRVAVRLRQGHNRVMLKVCQENGPLGFYLRQEAPEKGAAQVTASLPEVAPPLPAGTSPAARALPTVTTLLQQEVEKHPRDAQLRGEYATVLSFFRAYDERDHLATVQAESAAELAPRDARLALLAAELQEDDTNLRRKHLENAVAADPGDPHALLALAHHELGRGHPERAVPLLDKALAARPGFTAATLLLARADESLGEWPRAAQVLEGALAANPRLPTAVREAARVARRFERYPEAVERLRQALALRADDSNSRRALASILADLRDVTGAGAQMEQVLALDPFDNSTRLRLAELYAANERARDADALFAQAKALSYDEPDVFEREGRALLLQGRRDEALGAFEHALVLRPQNPALKEAIRAIKGEDTAFGSQFLLDMKPLVAEADSYAGEDAVYLVDYNYARVQPSGLASRFQQTVVKVYTQRGVDSFRSHSITYSPDRQEVKIIRARITKPDGSVVESYGEQDRAMNEPWSGMYYDSRSRTLTFPQLAPGDLLEMQYRLEDTAQDNLLSDYWGDVDYVQGVLPKVRYRFIVDMPSARPIYWNKGAAPPGVAFSQEEKDGRVVYHWDAKRVPKVVPEPSMPGWAEVASVLHVSTYKTWDQVGRYYWGLVRDQLLPNDELRRAVELALKGVDRKDERAVVSAVYNFVVSNTRYVALEFGIHGYKPYRVDRVLARRFGDCKDKASLIHAMLKVAGVDSRLVLLRMRHLGALGAEPASLAAFNHAIAYVPGLDLFLDGTAEFHGSRELPSADRVANVLVVEPDGNSRFFTTPEALAAQNVTSMALTVSLKPDGGAELKGQTTVTGQSAPEYRRAYQSPATRRPTFEQSWAQSFPGLTVQDVTLSDPTKLDQDVSMAYRMAVPRYAEVLSNGLRFHPFGSGRAYTETFAPLTERRFDMVMSGPWTNRFSFRYALPPGYAVRELPRDVTEESPFGTLKMTFTRDGDGLRCEGELAFTVARVKATDYPAFRAFLGRVDKDFARKVELSRPDGQSASR